MYHYFEPFVNNVSCLLLFRIQLLVDISEIKVSSSYSRLVVSCMSICAGACDHVCIH